ncbi:Cytochrome b-c1 complex subunit 10, fungi [Phaffia rhodozyma]|uniref:Cytochrome b-c1 complex subunit 10, fungi n=1 Tax=Phaffia rhodozyma TaxID=264483 RepID=A0A0F7SWP1_PHARH|nr:Cytochrome b-c1 complex subunit 10, fungi [Phaffia rhodozyma]
MAKNIFTPQPRVAYFTAEKIMRFVPSLGVWGVGAGGLITLLLSSTPIFQQDVLVKVPVLTEYYTDNTPASDKPF